MLTDDSDLGEAKEEIEYVRQSLNSVRRFVSRIKFNRRIDRILMDLDELIEDLPELMSDDL